MGHCTKTVAALSLILASSCLAAGCGQSSSSEEGDWVTAIGVVLGGFSTEQHREQAAIATATTATELQQAYLAYEGGLEREVGKLEAIDAPSQCEDVQADMESFARQSLALTRTLAHERELTEERYRELARKALALQSEFKAQIGPVAKSEHC
jgi:hypothetical protein